VLCLQNGFLTFSNKNMKTISAAERKRQIRERRRLLKQNRGSSSLPTVTAPSETADGGAAVQNNDADTDASNGRLENHLDQDVECSLLPTLHNHIAPSSDGKGPSNESQSTASKTLFSVVMSRSNKDSANVKMYAAKDTNNLATTPKSKKQISPTKSPGGYDVLKALDVANVYNEHLVKIENESGSNQGENDVEPEDEWIDAHIISKRTNLSSVMTYESSVQENLLDGMEAEIIEETRHMIDKDDLKRIKPFVHEEHVAVGVVDWSLKKRLRIESVPGRCLPGTMSSFAMGKNAHEQPLDDGYVHQLAVHYLSNSSMRGGSGRVPSTSESLEARWKASTMYYQHPAAYPLPPAILHEFPKAVQKKTLCAGDLSSFIRGPHSIYHRLRLAGCGSMGGLGESATSNGEKSKNGSVQSSTSDTSKLLEQRRCEWKEAFRSLFNSWRTKLRHLDARNSKHSKRNGRMSSLDNKKCGQPSTDEVLRCSFYLIKPEQVVLFRGCFMPLNVDGQVKQCIMPVVVFSSTTVYLRSMLNSMGIKMRVLSGNDFKDNDFAFFSEENLREFDDQIHASGVSGDTESVNAELEAIKWAGSGDGNVTVAQKNKKRRLDDSTFTSPLYCVGYNDCSAVFELFTNTCGLSLSSDNSPFEHRFDSEVSSDVPLLLCRSLGPGMHFTLKTLCVSGRRDYGYMNQMSSSKEEHKLDTTDFRTTLELRGPILPCALRDLTCSLIDWMLQDRHHTQSVSNQTSKPKANDEGVGSHHFALFLQSHEGECTALGPNPTGLSSASLFNGSIISVDQNETSTWHECSHGELLNVMVWDIHRANFVSYNSKHLPFSVR
jgi:hypothetical protein